MTPQFIVKNVKKVEEVNIKMTKPKKKKRDKEYPYKKDRKKKDEEEDKDEIYKGDKKVKGGKK